MATGVGAGLDSLKVASEIPKGKVSHLNHESSLFGQASVLECLEFSTASSMMAFLSAVLLLFIVLVRPWSIERSIEGSIEGSIEALPAGSRRGCLFDYLRRPSLEPQHKHIHHHRFDHQ